MAALHNDRHATLDWFAEACAPGPKNEAIRHWGRQILNRSTPAAVIRLYECLYGVDIRPQVAQITKPTLIIHGEADAILPVKESEWLAAHLSTSQLIIVPGAGHVPTMTNPKAVADAITQFFAAHPVT